MSPRRQRDTRWDSEREQLLVALGAAFRETWKMWLTERIMRRKPLSPYGEVLQLRDCAAWGVAAATKSIETSIKRGWTGLFYPRQDVTPVAEAAQGRKPTWDELEDRRHRSHDEACLDVLRAHERGEFLDRTVIQDKYRDLGKNSDGHTVWEAVQAVLDYRRKRFGGNASVTGANRTVEAEVWRLNGDGT